MQTEGEVGLPAVHVKRGLTPMQLGLQPRTAEPVPVSHVSPVTTWPSPQTGVQPDLGV